MASIVRLSSEVTCMQATSGMQDYACTGICLERPVSEAHQHSLWQRKLLSAARGWRLSSWWRVSWTRGKGAV